MHPDFIVENGTLIKYIGSETVVSIPEGVSRIGKSAFSDNTKLTELIMPDSVVSVDKSAFLRCQKLKSVVFSKQLVEIGSEAFRDCTALKQAQLPHTLKTIEYGAFAGCVKLSSLSCDSPVFEADSNPFSALDAHECSMLFDKNGFLIFNKVLFEYKGTDSTVSVPAGVKRINHSVFTGRSKIKKIILPDTVRQVGKHAFWNCSGLKELEMPDGIEFGEHAFMGCSKFEDDNGIIVIGKTAMEYAGKDTVVNIPAGIEILADELFSTDGFCGNPGNSKIIKVILPDSLKQIGKRCFSGCISLAEINIPESVKSIDDKAFNNCHGLADKDGFVIVGDTLFDYIGCEAELTVPEKVKRISSGAFNENQHVRKIKLPGRMNAMGAAFTSCSMLEEIVIPEGVTAIENESFHGCQNLRKVVLPESVTAIGKHAFAFCSSLEEINIPQATLQIGLKAFVACKALKSVSFPSGVKSLPDYVCAECDSLESVTLSEGLEGIEERAFSRCKALKEISLPKSLKWIAADAFSNCDLLERVEFSSKGCIISSLAFRNCHKLSDKSGMQIVGETLLGYSGDENIVTIDDNVTTIASNAFREGTEFLGRNTYTFRPSGSLREITISSSVKTISHYAFRACKKLEKINFSEGLEFIDHGAFSECNTLVNAVLPSTVKALGREAFAECNSLRSVTLPKNLGIIGSNAFIGCKALENIIVEDGNPNYSSHDGILYNRDKTELIYCPAGKKLKNFTVDSSVHAIADLAFSDCSSLKKIVIPASVKRIGNQAFLIRGIKRNLNDISVAIGAGTEFVGENIFEFCFDDSPIFSPCVPVDLPKEQSTQLLLCLAFCMSPEKYSEEYASLYRDYAKKHEKSLLKKAKALKLQQVLDYFKQTDDSNPVNGKIEKIKYTKLNEREKVELLERALLEGNLANLKEVIARCGKFEFTARALGIACLYGNIETVKTLVENGASFTFTYSPKLQANYGVAHNSTSTYQAQYSLMVASTRKNPYIPMLYTNAKTLHFGSLPKIGLPATSHEKRAEIAEYLLSANCGFEKEAALFYAILWGCHPVARKLMDCGVTLGERYTNAACGSANSAERSEFMVSMAALAPNTCVESIAMLSTCTKNGKQPVFSQAVYEIEKSAFQNSEVLKAALDYTDTSKISRTKLLELFVKTDNPSALTVLLEAGWLQKPAQRDKLIQLANDSKKTQCLALLLDYKNRTADITAEEAAAEAKMMRELTEKPDSVAAMKRIWGYKKLDNGTLRIISYKGSDTDIIVPDKIGKTAVGSIGEGAFGFTYTNSDKISNAEARKCIRSVVIPEGVTEICQAAFYGCEALEAVSLPESLRSIGSVAFRYCKSLEKITIPKTVTEFGDRIFIDCDKLNSEKFLILNNILFRYNGDEKRVEIPEGVVQIGPYALESKGFASTGIDEVVIPDTVELINRGAFYNTGIKTVNIPASVKCIAAKAFYMCENLENVKLENGLEYIGPEAFRKTRIRELVIPETVTRIGDHVFKESYALQDIWIPASVISIGDEFAGNSFFGTIHAPADSYAANYVLNKFVKFQIWQPSAD